MTIVVIAYNRVAELSILLNSLSKAEYEGDVVNLIISIDHGGCKKVLDLADSFEWPYGMKKVIKHTENLGLRKHVLSCGDLTQSIGDIIMLEDDLFVSPSFYKYTKQSLDFYRDEKKVAGISLYTYNINEYTGLRPFIPLCDDSDTYFMKIPSSWGQAWTAEQWKSFREWYNNNQDLYNKLEYVPGKVLNWSDSSWKKYFAVYLATQGKYFVYPRYALSTNMGAKGTHNSINTNNYQSILVGSFNRPYHFKRVDANNAIKYDSFFESINLKNWMSYKFPNVVIDYYGTKTIERSHRFLLSTKKLNFRIVDQWDLSLRPYELNILNNIKGSGLFLYDLSEKKKNKSTYYKENIKLNRYEIPYITKEKAFQMGVFDYYSAIKRKLKSYRVIK